MCVDVGENACSNYIQLMKEADPSVSEHTIKARKPYTITKQRDRWTEEEHNRFLEALKLYGRAWRRIEEHIGSKTTVQIRSHAQKFFSKVARESSSSSTCTTIDIPPPRPKRKPNHPYPRKLVQACSKKGRVADASPWPSLPKLSVSEPESKSPITVLSGAGSDTTGTSSNIPKHFGSSVSSAARSIATEAISNEQVMPVTELDLGIQGDSTSKEADSKEVTQPKLTSLKLFGKTVIVSNSPQQDISNNNTMECQDSLSDCNNIDQKNEQFDAVLNSSYDEPLNIAYYFPSHGSFMNSAEATIVSLPWLWALYGDTPFPFSFPNCAKLVPKDHFVEEDISFKESSQACSSTSAGNSEPPDVHCKKVLPASVLKQSKNSAFSCLKPLSSSSKRGFVPYKTSLGL